MQQQQMAMLQNLQGQVLQLQNGFTAFDSRLGRVEEAQEDVRGRFAELSARVDALEGTSAPVAAAVLSPLQESVALLESKLNALAAGSDAASVVSTEASVRLPRAQSAATTPTGNLRPLVIGGFPYDTRKQVVEKRVSEIIASLPHHARILVDRYQAPFARGTIAEVFVTASASESALYTLLKCIKGSPSLEGQAMADEGEEATPTLWVAIKKDAKQRRRNALLRDASVAVGKIWRGSASEIEICWRSGKLYLGDAYIFKVEGGDTPVGSWQEANLLRKIPTASVQRLTEELAAAERAKQRL